MHSRARGRTTPERPGTQSSSHPKNLTVELVHVDCLPQGTDLGCPLLSFQERSCKALGLCLPAPPLTSFSPLTAYQSCRPPGHTLYLRGGGVQGQAAFKRPSVPPMASKTLQLNFHPRSGNRSGNLLYSGNRKDFFLKSAKIPFLWDIKKKVNCVTE